MVGQSRSAILAVLFLLFAIPAFGQGIRIDQYGFVDQSGIVHVIPNAPVTVCTNVATGIPCSPTISIYSDIGLTTPIAQPGFTADTHGNIGFYINPSALVNGAIRYSISPTSLAPSGGLFTLTPGAYGFLSTPTLCTTGNAPTGILSNGNATGCAPISGGGTGCTISGPDTSVVTVHPFGSCYSSADFTWDDATSRKNLIAGDGTNTQAADSTPNKNLLFTLGASDASFGQGVFNFGQSQTVGEATSPMVQGFAFGQANTLCNTGTEGTPGCQNLYVTGKTNAVSGQLSVVSGQGNNLTEAAPAAATAEPSNIHILGDVNSVAFSGTGPTSGTYLSNQTIVGDRNQTLAVGYDAQVSQIYALGKLNEASATGTGSSGSQFTQTADVYMVGNANSVDSIVAMALPAVMNKIFSFGNSNTLAASGGCNMTNIFTFGNINSDTCGTPSNTVTDLYLIGRQNVYGASAGSPTNFSNIMAVGSSNAFSNCSNCMLVGMNGFSALSNSLGIGVSSTPEIVVTAGNVKMNATFQATGTSTGSDCEVNSVSPAACAAACAGSFVIPTTTTTYTVNTTCPSTNNSKFFLFPRTDATGLPGVPTCVTPAITSSWNRSAHTNNVSFTIALPSTAGSTCWDYWIISN